MKNMMSIMCLGLALFAINAHAAQESYGLPSGEKELLQCDALRNSKGEMELGVSSPLIVEKAGILYAKRRVIYPNSIPFYIELNLLDKGTNSNELNYRSTDNSIALALTLDKNNNPIAGDVQVGDSSAHCTPLTAAN